MSLLLRLLGEKKKTNKRPHFGKRRWSWSRRGGGGGFCHIALEEAQSAEARSGPRFTLPLWEGLQMQKDQWKQFSVLCQVPTLSLWVPELCGLAVQ